MSQNYEPEFKKKIIRLHLEEGRSLKGLAEGYGVSKASISRYYRIKQTSAYIVAVLVLYFLVQHYHQQIYNLEEYPLSYQ